MPTSFSPQDALDFVNANTGVRVQGGPFLLGAGAPIETLGDYVIFRQPVYGVIVRVNARSILVWYDASGVLHVIDVTGEPIASEVPRGPYEPPDSSLIEAILSRLEELRQGLPSMREATYGVMAVGVLALVFFMRKK